MFELKNERRYTQIAFNNDKHEVARILPLIPPDPRIFIEAGTPYIKHEGIEGIRFIRRYWKGFVVADLKIADGAEEETQYAALSGANAATVLGSAPHETLEHFMEACRRYRIYGMIDFIGVDNPLKRIMPMKIKPDFVIIHKGRDEESNRSKMIRYKDISKVRSKYDVFISVAGGITPDHVRTAYFNGANVAIINIVQPGTQREGISSNADFRIIIQQILAESGE